jgi:hypothetical protein
MLVGVHVTVGYGTHRMVVKGVPRLAFRQRHPGEAWVAGSTVQKLARRLR